MSLKYNINPYIGIIGYGYVGSALWKVVKEDFITHVYDPYKEYTDFNSLLDCKYIFICVSTPMNKNGSCDIKAVRENLSRLKNKNYKGHIIIKSSIVPGTCDELEKEYNLKLSYNPEFLRQNFAVEDMEHPSRVVLGRNGKNIYKDIYSKLYNNDVKYIYCSNKEAEMIKYASNIMLASQVGIANELYRICDIFSINYNKVKEGMLLDNRIGRNLDVPGHDKQFGFGGACFPKDLNALIYSCKQKEYNASILKEIWKQNKKYRSDL